MECPICDKYITNYHADNLDQVLTEESFSCSNGCLRYSFYTSYGPSETRVGNVILLGHYTDSRDDRNFIDRQFRKAVQLERKRYFRLLKEDKSLWQGLMKLVKKKL